MNNNDKLYSAWENISTDYRMFFLINQTAMLTWELRKSGDKKRLVDFRERLQADLCFADDELHELELRNRIKAILLAEIDEHSADEFSALSNEIRSYLSKFTDDED